MSKFISKQSVAIWYALSALLATFIVGQVILCFFPDGKSTGDSLLFILMILGNTFLLGALKEYSKGAVPCILAHMLIDSLAVLMLVQSSLPQIILLVIFEIMLASWLVAMRKS